jgi:hypothetical protein
VKHPVLTYFALTFAISWGGALLAIGGAGGMSGTAPTDDPRFPIAVLAMLGGPSVAGILLTGLVHGRAGLRALLSRLLTWRMGARWYVLALLTAPVLMTAALLALSLTSPAFLPGIFTSEDRTTLLLVGLAVGLGAGFVEELGWTGFAVPELRRRHGVLSSLLVAMLMHLSFTASLLILNPLAISGVALVTYSFALAAAVWIVVAAVVVANGGWPGSLPGGSRIRAA